MSKRNRDIVIKSQFNIHGSRGKSVKNFIAGYVARDAATDASLAWLPPTDRPSVQGDGVVFTLDSTAISREIFKECILPWSLRKRKFYCPKKMPEEIDGITKM